MIVASSGYQRYVKLLQYLKLSNVGPAPELEVQFAPRLNLITGDNGLGKSFLLDLAWWALTRRWPKDLNSNLTSGYAARPTNPEKPATIGFGVSGKKKPVEYVSKFAPRDGWVGKSGRPWNPGLVIYAHADGGFSVWDPARNYWKTNKGIDIQERLPGYVFSSLDVWNGLEVNIDGKPTVVCNGLIRDWANWIREDGADSKRMATVLRRLSPSKEAKDLLKPGPLTRPFPDDVRDVPSLHMPYGQDVPVVFASSGVRRILALSYMLLWAWKEHAIAARNLGEERTRQVTLLVDEIESHLHPRWQRTILSSILSLAKLQHATADIQLIAATHSPLVLASAEPLFDGKSDAWFDLDLEIQPGKDPAAKLRNREFVRRGEISNWLTSEAFDLKSARNVDAEHAIELAKSLLRSAKPTLGDALEIDKSLRKAALPDIDPFWVKWSAFVDSLKTRK